MNKKRIILIAVAAVIVFHLHRQKAPKRFSKLYQTTSIPVMLKGILMPCIAIQSISFSQRSQSQKAME